MIVDWSRLEQERHPRLSCHNRNLVHERPCRKEVSYSTVRQHSMELK